MEMGWWITGFVDGEGCFCVSFARRQKAPFRLDIRPSFSVTQSIRESRQVLHLFPSYFGCGTLRISRHDRTIKYEVRALEALWTRILPHFHRFPLLSKKASDFHALTRVCELLRGNQHRHRAGLVEVIDVATGMNGSGKRRYSREFLLALVDRISKGDEGLLPVMGS